MGEGCDTIFIEGARLFGFIGVFPEEKENGQHFLVDIELTVDLEGAGKSDRLEDTVSYAEVFGMAKTLMDEARCDLIENYAETLSSSILDTYKAVHCTRIRVRKPDAPIKGSFGSVGVEIRRKRK